MSKQSNLPAYGLQSPTQYSNTPTQIVSSSSSQPFSFNNTGLFGSSTGSTNSSFSLKGFPNSSSSGIFGSTTSTSSAFPTAPVRGSDSLFDKTPSTSKEKVVINQTGLITSNQSANLNSCFPSGFEVKVSQATKNVLGCVVKEEEKKVSPSGLDESLNMSTVVDETGVNRKSNSIKFLLKSKLKKEYEIAWLLRAITCIDLTTLSGDDTDTNVARLCYKAAHPLSNHLLQLMKDVDFVENITTAAVCVYPARVNFASSKINALCRGTNKVNVASVATGFPSGQYPLETKLKEIEYCVINGANEIDIVINRELVLSNKWDQLYNEIKQMRLACGKARMKTILATGECGSLSNVYNASMIAMRAGTDFIKTSTGKETVNATLQVGVVMCRAIHNFCEESGRKVGLKPAGGIKTSQDALAWLVLVKEMLGEEWLNSKMFRIGASGLLGDIEKRLFYLFEGYQPTKEYFFTQ